MLGLTASLLSLGAVAPASGAPARALAPAALDTSAAGSPANVTVGKGHACARMSSGQVWCWGRNDRGQLGYATAGDISPIPKPVPGITDAVQVAAGDFHTCARLFGGTVKCWGANSSGQLGNGTTVDSVTPVVATGVTESYDLAAGRAHTCAITPTSVYCWGANGFGQLGQGSVTDADLRLSSQIDQFGMGALAVDSAGSTYVTDPRNLVTGRGTVWRFNDSGLLTGLWRVGLTDPFTIRAASVAVGADPTQAYAASRQTADAWILSGDSTVSASWNVASTIPGCTSLTCPGSGLAVGGDGKVYAAVRDGSGRSYITASQPGVGALGHQDVTALVGRVLDIAMVKTGATGKDELWVLGNKGNDADAPQPVLVAYSTEPSPGSLLTQTKNMTATVPDSPCNPPNIYSNVGIVVTVGNTTTAQYVWQHDRPSIQRLRLGNGPDNTLTLSAYYSVERRRTGLITGPFTGAVAPIDNGSNYSQIAITPDDPDADQPPTCVFTLGTVPTNQGEPPVSDTLTGSSILIPADAAASATGGLIVSQTSGAPMKRFNAVGIPVSWGEVPLRTVPTKVLPARLSSSLSTNPVEGFFRLAVGANHTCVNGQVDGQSGALCWGDGAAGQTGWPAAGSAALRNGLAPSSTDDRSSFPVFIRNLFAFGDGGDAHTCYTNSSFRQCIGSNEQGQLGANPVSEGAVALATGGSDVAAGSLHTCILDNGSTVQCVGNNSDGQTAATVTGCASSIRVQTSACATLESVVDVAAGGKSSCAVTSTGSVYCWGDNSDLILGTAGSPLGAVKIDFGTATTWSVQPPASISSGVVVTFAGAVDQPLPDQVQLRVKGTTSPLATGRVCCGVGGTTVTLKPTAPLIPGQRYEVAVNSTDGPALLVGGLTAQAATQEFRAPTSVAENSPAARFAWATKRTSAALGGSWVQEQTRGSALTYSFTGKSVTWYGVTGPTMGKATVSIDGKSRTIDLYSATQRTKVPFAWTGLSASTHTMKIAVAGTKNAKSTGYTVAVDAFKVGSAVTSTPVVAFSAASASSSKAVGGKVFRSLGAGSTFTFRFRGTSVTWRTLVGPDQGDAVIAIDGSKKGTYSQFARASAAKARTWSGLSDKVHTVTVTVLGKGRGALDFVSVDGWTVK